MPVFGSVISLDRFESISRFLHFINNTSKDTSEAQQKLFKIYPITRHLNLKLQNLYLPKQDISVDESLILWMGRLAFKQYHAQKSSQFGIKLSEPLLHKGYILWIDNYYNSPALVKFLKSCNPLCRNRQSKQEGYAEEATRKQPAER
jgi:hypothetical protein